MTTLWATAEYSYRPSLGELRSFFQGTFPSCNYATPAGWNTMPLSDSQGLCVEIQINPPMCHYEPRTGPGPDIRERICGLSPEGVSNLAQGNVLGK